MCAHTNSQYTCSDEFCYHSLKEEVIAQGIELQRRWIRDIKVRVEQERGGRLAKLDELATNLKRLERIALDNSAYLDENIRIHALWSALRALNHNVDASVRKPFREELRILRHIAAAREDPIVSSVLEILEASDVPDVGVEPLADLATWFTTSVVPAVSSVALVPDQNAGVLSHLASHLVSTFTFRRQGLVPGSDVLSVLARAEYYLNEKDLDSAARELNQLQGTAKVLLSDWLAAARRRLEVVQVLEVSCGDSSCQAHDLTGVLIGGTGSGYISVSGSSTGLECVPPASVHHGLANLNIHSRCIEPPSNEPAGDLYTCRPQQNDPWFPTSNELHLWERLLVTEYTSKRIQSHLYLNSNVRALG